jgi:hypothetical protein
MTKHTQAEAKSASIPIPTMPPAHSGLLPQQEQEEPNRSLLSSEDRLRSPDSPNPIFINPSLVGHSFGSMAIGPTTSPVLQRKLGIGQPNDRYEQEASQVASWAMATPAYSQISKVSDGAVQRLVQPLVTPAPTNVISIRDFIKLVEPRLP